MCHDRGPSVAVLPVETGVLETVVFEIEKISVIPVKIVGLMI